MPVCADQGGIHCLHGTRPVVVSNLCGGAVADDTSALAVAPIAGIDGACIRADNAADDAARAGDSVFGMAAGGNLAGASMGYPGLLDFLWQHYGGQLCRRPSLAKTAGGVVLQCHHLIDAGISKE